MGKKATKTLAALALALLTLTASLEYAQAADFDLSNYGNVGVYVYETNSKRVLVDYHSDERTAPASTVKLLTAFTAYEGYIKTAKVDSFQVTKEMLSTVEPDSSRAGLVDGEVLTWEQILHAMMLPSGNDAARVVAVNCGMTKPEYDSETATARSAMELFVADMNLYASRLGMMDSNFLNPDGYPKSGMYSTPKDMATVGLAAMGIEDIAAAVDTQSYKAVTNLKTHNWTNTNRMLQRSNENYNALINGMKTGSTDDARTFVFSAVNEDGMEIVGAAMNVEYTARVNIWKVANDTTGFAFEKFTRVALTNEETKTLSLSVANHAIFEASRLPVFTSKVDLYDCLENGYELELKELIANDALVRVLPNGSLELKGDLSPQDVIVTAVYFYNGKEVARIPYIATKVYMKADFLDYVAVISIITICFLILAQLLLTEKRQRTRRKRRRRNGYRYVRQGNH